MTTRSVPICSVRCSDCCVISAELRRSMRLPLTFADGCVAFVGESGAGKSTLVAALARRGHQVIADDRLLSADSTIKATYRAGPALGAFVYGRRR